MVKLEDAVIARLEKAGEKFEVLVDPELALKFKKGEKVDFNSLLASDIIYKDARKGEEVSSEALNKAFGFTETEKAAKKIILEGEVQLTTEQRRRFLEAKRKEIINLIARNAVNPQTNAPHPPQRIENAMNEAKIHIDAVKPAADQVNDILKEIRKLIPISFEKQELALKIPAQFSGQALGVLKKYDLKKQEWGNDGSLMAVMEVPAGITQELLNELNHLTHGEFQSKLMEKRKNG
ncbi:MAG TPA: ribosome assembly factor SBDS [archaeon]|nr:ribosome assembly factor SBDS [archaeon]